MHFCGSARLYFSFFSSNSTAGRYTDSPHHLLLLHSTSEPFSSLWSEDSRERTRGEKNRECLLIFFPFLNACVQASSPVSQTLRSQVLAFTHPTSVPKIPGSLIPSLEPSRFRYREPKKVESKVRENRDWSKENFGTTRLNRHFNCHCKAFTSMAAVTAAVAVTAAKAPATSTRSPSRPDSTPIVPLFPKFLLTAFFHSQMLARLPVASSDSK